MQQQPRGLEVDPLNAMPPRNLEPSLGSVVDDLREFDFGASEEQSLTRVASTSPRFER